MMFARTPNLLAVIALTALAGLSAALIAQHLYGVKPCAWCVMQRGIFLLISVVAALGWLAQRWFPARLPSLMLILVLAVLGLAAAYYQYDVASKLDSCAMTLADRVVTWLNLEELWPWVFMITAHCVEASAYRLLGFPYEVWSAALYLLLGLGSLWGLPRRAQR